MAQWDWKATEERELNFQTGDRIVVTGKHPGGWWYGYLQNDATKTEGMFSANYAKFVSNDQESATSFGAENLGNEATPEKTQTTCTGNKAYAYEDLIKRPLEIEGVENTKLESYLSDEQFQEVHKTQIQIKCLFDVLKSIDRVFILFCKLTDLVNLDFWHGQGRVLRAGKMETSSTEERPTSLLSKNKK